MPVFRVILRVDYETSFDMMDRPGAVAKSLLDNAPSNFFQAVQESPQDRVYRGEHKEEDIAYQFQVGPRFLFFTYSVTQGVEFQALLNDEIFLQLTGLMRQIRTQFHVFDELRCGLRATYLGSIWSDRNKSQTSFQSLVPPAIRDLSRSFGAPTDVGFNIDGGDDMTRSYHLRVGPYLGPSEAHRYFALAPKDEQGHYDVVVDLDQYVLKTAHGPDLAWWRPFLLEGDAALRSLKSALKSTPPQ